MAFCENCGNELNDGDDFCPECGTKNRMAVTKTGKSYKIPIIIGYVMVILTLFGGFLWPIISIAIAVFLLTRPEANFNNNDISTAVGSLINDPSGVIKELIHNPDDNLYLHGLLLIALPIILFLIVAIISYITAPEEEWYYVVWYN